MNPFANTYWRWAVTVISKAPHGKKKSTWTGSFERDSLWVRVEKPRHGLRRNDYLMYNVHFQVLSILADVQNFMNVSLKMPQAKIGVNINLCTWQHCLLERTWSLYSEVSWNSSYLTKCLWITYLPPLCLIFSLKKWAQYLTLSMFWELIKLMAMMWCLTVAFNQ